MNFNEKNITDFVMVKKGEETVLQGYLVAVDSEQFVVCAYKVADACSKLVNYETLMPNKTVEDYLKKGDDPEYFIVASVHDSAFEYHRFSFADYSLSVIEGNLIKPVYTGTTANDADSSQYDFEKNQFNGFHFRLEYGLPLGFNIFITSVSSGLITGVWRGLKFCSKGVDLENIHIGIVNNFKNNPRQIERFQVNKWNWVETQMNKLGKTNNFENGLSS